MTSVVSSTPSFNKRVLKDVCKIIKEPLTDHGIYYFHSETNIMEGHALIFGPVNTIYEYYLRMINYISICSAYESTFSQSIIKN